jgi:hypothetical protein
MMLFPLLDTQRLEAFTSGRVHLQIHNHWINECCQTNNYHNIYKLEFVGFTQLMLGIN